MVCYPITVEKQRGASITINQIPILEEKANINTIAYCSFSSITIWLVVSVFCSSNAIVPNRSTK